ncbi:MAG: TonB-dependent receptor, partial [Candidatus Eremiobacteraeota bacterium]|nr:TonB-dependent receptor [Candidatus Eremiobacteraeota bacterium]
MADPVHVCLARLVVSLLLAFGSFAASAQAQDETRVTVRVLDQQSKRGVALARVVISGPAQRLGYTDATGSVTFDGVPAGLYRMTLAAPAYQLGRAQFDVHAGETVAVEATLVSTKLPAVIGSVTVHSAPSSGVTDYGRTGAVRKTNDSLPDALRFDPNAFVGDDGSVSINGAPASSTAYTLDGIPLGGGGGPGFDARRINADLFSAVSVSQDPTNGGTAGSVDLRSYEPTIAFQSALAARFASNADSSLSSVVTGSTGNLGYVLSGAAQGRNGALAGQRFFDASGSDYVHGDAAFTGGLLAKLRLGLTSTQSLSATALRQNTRADETCADFGALVPCGWGPGVGDTSSLALAGATYTGVFDRLSVLAVPYARSERYDENLLGRSSFGVPDPAAATVASVTDGVRASATFDATDRAQYELATSVSRTRFTSNATDGASSSVTALDRLFEDASLGVRLRVSNALTVRPGLRWTRADTQSHASTDLSATWSPRRTDTVAVAYAPRRYGVSTAFRGALAAPASVTLDCAGADALATGGGDASTDPATSQLRASWQHQGKTVRTIISAFRAHLVDALIPGYVNAAALAAGEVPPGYAAAISTLYRSPMGCDAAAPLALSDVLVQQPVSIPAETTAGFSLAASARVGRSLLLVPAYTATYARADALDARFAAPRSVLVPGAQLPGIPMHRWSLVADYRRPSGGPEAILTLQHVGENNPSRLPGYTLLGAGLSLPTAHGTIVVSGYNLTNRFAGAFASPVDAVPLATNAGAPFALLARPLAGRRVTVSYDVAVGRGVAARAAATTSGLPDEAERNTVHRFDIDSLPATAPPLDEGLRDDPAAPSCVPEALRDADPILRALRTYAAALANAPDRAVVPAPRISGVTIAYHPLANGYELLFDMDRRTTLAVGRCGHFVYADRDDAQRLALGARPDLKSWQLDFRYEPRFGLFLVERAGLVTTGRGPRPPLPAAPPADPFQPVASAACTSAERPAVATLLQQLAPLLAGA